MRMIERLSCPFCNSQFDSIPANPKGRVTCPRCGESFTPRRSLTPSLPLSESVGTQATIYAAVSVNGSYPPPRSNPIGLLQGLKPLLLLAGSLVLILVVAFCYYLWNRHPIAPTKPMATAVIPALKYLPPSADIILGWQPGSEGARSEDAWNALDLLGMKSRVEKLSQDWGIPPSQVRLLLLALELPDDSAIPKLFAVLQWNEPLADRRAFFRALRASRRDLNDAETGERYTTIIAGFPLELLVLDEQTYLFATESAALTAVQTRLRDLPDPATFRCHEAMRRLPSDSLAWLATGTIDWASKPTVKLALQLAQRQAAEESLAGIRRLAVGITGAPNRMMRLAVEALDANAADPLTALIPTRIAEDPAWQQRREEAWWIREWPLSTNPPWPKLSDWLGSARP